MATQSKMTNALLRAAARIKVLEAENSALKAGLATRRSLATAAAAAPPRKRPKLSVAPSFARSVADIAARCDSYEAAADGAPEAGACELIANDTVAAINDIAPPGAARRASCICAHLGAIVTAIRAHLVADRSPSALAMAAVLENAGRACDALEYVRAARCDILVWQLVQRVGASSADVTPPPPMGALACVTKLAAVGWPVAAAADSDSTDVAAAVDGGLRATAESVVLALVSRGSAAPLLRAEELEALDAALATTLSTIKAAAADGSGGAALLACAYRAAQLQSAARGWAWAHDVLLRQRIWPLASQSPALRPAVLGAIGAVGAIALLLGERDGLPAMRSTLIQILNGAAEGAVTHASHVAAASAALQIWSGRGASLLLRTLLAWRRRLSVTQQRALPVELQRALAAIARRR